MRSSKYHRFPHGRFILSRPLLLQGPQQNGRNWKTSFVRVSEILVKYLVMSLPQKESLD